MHQLLTNFCSAFGYHLDYYQRDSKATVSHHHFTLNVSCVPIIPTFALCSHRHLGTLILIGAAKKQLKDTRSRVAQWKRAGPITQRSEDQNLALLFLFLSVKKCDTFLQNPERTRIVLVRTREYSSFWVFQEYSVCTFVLVSYQIITFCNINSFFLLDHQCHINPWLHRYF